MNAQVGASSTEHKLSKYDLLKKEKYANIKKANNEFLK